MHNKKVFLREAHLLLYIYYYACPIAYINTTMEQTGTRICASGLKVLVYSGDHDRTIPTQGSEQWTSQLGRELGGQLTDFAPWWREVPESFGHQV